MKKVLLGLMLAVTFGAQADQIGKVTTSGIFFKDSIEIYEFQDPTVDGIACHITYADKSFSTDNPTDSSISCRQTKQVLTSKGPIGSDKENIFKKSKSLFFKVMKVDRFYDEKNNTLVYISYTKKAEGNNAAHAISSIPLWSAKVIEIQESK
ncbi:CreA protein [Vibrio phage 2.275.O._10N.286.54.E11]|nr:CreA protein [Vibrio phage 2.275.O._10N.286.54.E11]